MYIVSGQPIMCPIGNALHKTFQRSRARPQGLELCARKTRQTKQKVCVCVFVCYFTCTICCECVPTTSFEGRATLFVLYDRFEKGRASDERGLPIPLGPPTCASSIPRVLKKRRGIGHVEAMSEAVITYHTNRWGAVWEVNGNGTTLHKVVLDVEMQASGKGRSTGWEHLQTTR